MRRSVISSSPPYVESGLGLQLGVVPPRGAILAVLALTVLIINLDGTILNEIQGPGEATIKTRVNLNDLRLSRTRPFLGSFKPVVNALVKRSRMKVG